MGSYDNWKTTEPDDMAGEIPCELCGDRATCTPHLQGMHQPIALCAECDADRVARCDDCGAFIWQFDGYKVANEGDRLFCAYCASKKVGVALGRQREARRDDEKHDHFEQVRR